MKEQNDELIDTLLGSKLNWWNRLWRHRVKHVKVKRLDPAYLECLDSIRQEVVRNNNGSSEEDAAYSTSEEDAAYSTYIDRIRGYLKRNKKRILTKQEEEIVIAHLVLEAETFCLAQSAKRNDAAPRSLNITQYLAMRAAKKVCEIHPDLTVTEKEVNQKMAEGSVCLCLFR